MDVIIYPQLALPPAKPGIFACLKVASVDGEGWRQENEQQWKDNRPRHPCCITPAERVAIQTGDVPKSAVVTQSWQVLPPLLQTTDELESLQGPAEDEVKPEGKSCGEGT